MTVAGGSGTWLRPGTGETGNQSVSMTFNGNQVLISRVFVPQNQAGTRNTATMRAQFDGQNTVTGSGPEANSGGRNCDISMRRGP